MKLGKRLPLNVGVGVSEHNTTQCVLFPGIFERPVAIARVIPGVIGD